MEKNILFEEHSHSRTDGSSKDSPKISQSIGSLGKPIQLSWPTDYQVITQAFGANPELHYDRNLPGHEGLDIRAPQNSRVYCCADGVVETIHIQDDDNYANGHFVIVLHNEGYRTTYGHLGKIQVNKGQKVKSGELIGYASLSGQTGGGTIHLGLSKEGATASGLTHYPNNIIDPTPFLSFSSKPGKAISYPWVFGRCLTGIRLNSGESNAMSDRTPEAVLLEMNTEKEAIRGLRTNYPTLFLLSQLSLPKVKKPLSAVEWVAWVRPFIQNQIAAGVGFFSLLNTPNLTKQGFGYHWNSGKGFGRWFLDAAMLIKDSFPDVKLGFPALAPGDQIVGQRYPAAVFMEEADEVILQADWLGVNCYWNQPQEMFDEETGGYYKKLRRYYPEQLIFITDFGNKSSIFQGMNANEASRYLESVKDAAGIGAAFA